MDIVRADQRGVFDHGWLETRHTFSFASYRNPQRMGFRKLRVMNEDRVRPGEGFGKHPHEDMEILSWVISGELRHGDSLGNGSVIRAGELQRMTAGTGVVHSEANGSETEPVHFYQVWILPESSGLLPGYEQRAFPESERRGRFRLLASRDGRDGSLTVHQDVALYGAVLEPEARIVLPFRIDRHGWLQIVRGEIELGGVALGSGDGVAFSLEAGPEVVATSDAELLAFDLG